MTEGSRGHGVAVEIFEGFSAGEKEASMVICLSRGYPGSGWKMRGQRVAESGPMWGLLFWSRWEVRETRTGAGAGRGQCREIPSSSLSSRPWEMPLPAASAGMCPFFAQPAANPKFHGHLLAVAGLR